MTHKQFTFRPSTYLILLIILAYFLAMLALLALPLPLWAQISLCSLLSISLFYHLQRDARLSLNRSYQALKTDGENWWLLNRQGDIFPVEFCADSVVTPWLLVLNMRQEKRFAAHHLVLLPDSLAAEELRQLRVELKWNQVVKP